MLASVRVRVTHLLLRVLSRARECSLARSAFWHASVSRVSRERLARFVTFLVSGTVDHYCSLSSEGYKPNQKKEIVFVGIVY